MESKERQKSCPLCGHRHLVKNGYRIRDFVGLPVGGEKLIIRMKVQRYKCMNKECDMTVKSQYPLPQAAAATPTASQNM